MMRSIWPSLALAAAILAAGGAIAQPHAARDLTGVWSNNSLTRLQRPAGVVPLVVTPAEASAAERKLMTSYRPGATTENVGGTATEWWDEAHLGRVDGQLRTSWLIDPDDGQLPYSAEGQRRVAAFAQGQLQGFDGPESRPVAGDRCLLPSWGAMGPVMLNSPYSALYKFVQTRNALAILAESNDELRIIHIGAKHLPDAIRNWTGDSVGHWERDTLVVETANLRTDAPLSQAPFFYTEGVRIVERFTRVSKHALKYEFSVQDPVIFARPWRAEMSFVATSAAIYESACHEGNYGMTNVLAGARAVERAQAASATRQ